ncbi:MAG: hypothetical protein Q8P67_13940, partial [archaeon]|nr:hypothetical protein [archaeon]
SASLPTMALPTIHRSGMPVQILPSIYSLSASSGHILPSPHEFFNPSGQLPSPVGLSHPTMPFAYARPSQPPMEAPLRQQPPITVRCSANAMVVDIPILKPISFQELLLLICSVHLLNMNLIDKLYLWRFQNQQWVNMLLSTDADVGWLQDQDVIEVILYSSDLMAKRPSDEMSSGSSHMDYDAKRQRT